MLGLFKNEGGSTSLTVVLAIAVAACLLSASIQWYWVNSSASDVQLAADLGAIAYQEAVGRTVLVMQIIDVTIMSANLLGLILHGLVVVGSIAAATQAPLGGGVSASLLPKLVEIDKNYVQRRKQFVDQLFTAAQALNKITPYVSFAYARKLVDENNELRTNFTKAKYGVIPIPFPLQGKVERVSSFPKEQEVLGSVQTAGEDNKQTTADIQRLQSQVEALRQQCFELDAYRDESALSPTWKPAEAIADYQRVSSDKVASLSDIKNELIPIDDQSTPAQDRINAEFLRNNGTVKSRVVSAVEEALGIGTLEGTQALSYSDIFGSLLNERVYLVPHNADERKAYHSDLSCSGLYNAQSAPEHVSLLHVYEQEEHPPCSLCLPFNWQAVSKWAQAFDPFIAQWNKEEEALHAYADAQRKLEEEQKKLRTQTDGALQAILKEAKDMLASDRLRYQPPGSRGVICVAYAQSQGNQPDFTLARLTGTQNDKAKAQFALAAARLKPSSQSRNVGGIVQGQRADYHPNNSRFGSVVFAFLDGDAGLFGKLAGLWNGATNFFTRGSSGLEGMFNKLPWGIGAIATNFMTQLQKTAGVSQPDMRTYSPFLVNTAEVGDGNAPGVEGAFVKGVRSSKQLFEKGARLDAAATRMLAQSSLNALVGESSSNLAQKRNMRIFDAFFEAPFSSTLTWDANATIRAARQSLGSLSW